MPAAGSALPTPAAAATEVELATAFLRVAALVILVDPRADAGEHAHVLRDLQAAPQPEALDVVVGVVEAHRAEELLRELAGNISFALDSIVLRTEPAMTTPGPAAAGVTCFSVSARAANRRWPMWCARSSPAASAPRT